jgi:hypothetical protein
MYLRDGPYFFKFDNIHDADNENFAESDKMDAVQRKAKEPRHWPGGWGGYSEDDMIAAGVAQVKKDTGGGAASASDAKKDAARAKSPAKGKAPIAGSSKVETEGEAPLAGSSNGRAVEEAEEVEDEEVNEPNLPPKKRRKKENSSKKNIGSLDVRCRDSNMAIGCASFQSDNRWSNPCASGHDCTGPAQPSEDFAFGLLRVRARHILERQRRLESLV